MQLCSLCSGMHTFYLRLRVAIVLSLLLSQAPIKQLWQQIHCLWYKQPESVCFKPKTLQHHFNYSANTPTGCRLPFHFNHSTGKIITAQALYYRLNAVYLIFCSLIVLTGSFKQKSMGKKVITTDVNVYTHKTKTNKLRIVLTWVSHASRIIFAQSHFLHQ